MIALPRPRWAAITAVAMFVVLELGYAVWVVCITHGRLGPRVGYGPDSIVYLMAARSPVWSRSFLAGPGPFGFLLLAKLSARNLRAIVVMQTIVAACAWPFLATTVVSVLRSQAARWLALVSILGVGVSPIVLQWNAFITTESLSISLLCVTIALGLRLVLRGSRPDLVWFVAGAAAFAFTRDTNALVIGVIALVALATAIRPAARVRGLVVGGAGLALALGASSLANAADPPRWYWPVGETVSIRLLADPGARAYLVDHGFPLDARTRDLPQRYIYIVHDVVSGRAYAPMRAWLSTDGRRAYVDFLLTHPGYTLRKPFDDRGRLFDPGVDVYGIVYQVQPRAVFGLVGGLATPPGVPGIELWTLAVALALGWCLIRGRRRSFAAVISLVLLLAFAGFYAAWHGDALEADRHALTSAVQLRLALWIGAAFFLDLLMTRRDASPVGVPREAQLHGEEHHGHPADEAERDRVAVDPDP